jgi:hypothetical protein
MTSAGSQRTIRIFVSSTFEDLKPYREAVFQALSRPDITVICMETLGAQPDTPLAAILPMVAQSNLYVGIFAMRYGTIPDGHDKSITHLRRAMLPVITYCQSRRVRQ